MKYLALDIGRRRTGVAYAESGVGIALPLPTLHHKNFQELLEQVAEIIRGRSIEHIVLGLPRLPSGEEGEQAEYVHSFIPYLENLGLPHSLIDERYTSKTPENTDNDAAAACAILTTQLDLE